MSNTWINNELEEKEFFNGDDIWDNIVPLPGQIPNPIEEKIDTYFTTQNNTKQTLLTFVYLIIDRTRDFNYHLSVCVCVLQRWRNNYIIFWYQNI